MDEEQQKPVVNKEADNQPASDGGNRVMTLMESLGKSKDLQEVKPENSELMKEWGLSIQKGKLFLTSGMGDKSWPSMPSFEDETKVTALAVLLKSGDKRLVVVQDIGGPTALVDFAKDWGHGGGLQVAASGGLEKDDMQWLAEQVGEVKAIISGIKDGEWSVRQ